MGKKFLDKGGRLVLTGEHNLFNKNGNQMLSRYVENMGGGITVGPTTLSHKAVKIAKFALTGGVKTGTYSTGTWAPLHVKASVTDVIMTNGQGQIFCADQVLQITRHHAITCEVNPRPLLVAPQGPPHRVGRCEQHVSQQSSYSR
jgi:hypothetical protein